MSHGVPTISLDQVDKGRPSPSRAFRLQELAWEHFKVDPKTDRLEAIGIEDRFLKRCAEQCGGLEGGSILELGPYEGFHSVLLDSLGPAEVISIEANPRNFLKCLVVKNHYQLDRTQFLLGDLAKYLAETARYFSLISALGILYHLNDPFEVLELMIERTDAIAVCTTYYHKEFQLFRFTGRIRQVHLPGLEPIVLHERINPTGTLGRKHGAEREAWMFALDDLLRYFESRGFECDTFLHREGPDAIRMRFLARRAEDREGGSGFEQPRRS